MTMHVDEVVESQLAGEPVGATERLCREPGQVVDVRRYPFGEQGLQDGVGQHLVVEELLEAMECVVATGMLVQGFHCRLHFESLSKRLWLSSVRPYAPHLSRSRVGAVVSHLSVRLRDMAFGQQQGPPASARQVQEL